MSLGETRAGLYLDLMTVRLHRLAMLLGIGLLIVAGGYWYLQIVRAEHFRALAENNRLREVPVQAPRGLIEDRRGRLLVENIPSYNLLFLPSLSADETESLRFAAGILGRPLEELREALAKTAGRSLYQPRLLAEDLDLSQVARFEARGLEHPEFRVDVLQRRLYRHGEQTAHLLGYLSEATLEDLRASSELEAGDLVGREGTELAYDDRLRGVDGRRVVVVDSRGREIEPIRSQAAVRGERLRLTIDLELQQEAQQLLAGKTGAVVALDPRDGAVRALVSAPSYDPNLFAKRLQPEVWQAIVSSPRHVLQNRTLNNAYAPGSVFKIVLGLAGLMEDVVAPGDRVFCGGSKKIFDRQRRCWKRAGHGWMDLRDAIKHSCDIYFYDKGLDLGIETIAAYARRLGLGRPTGIDLSGERGGLVPDTDWSRRVRRTPWYPGETVSVAIGQGPILTTPLQIAALTASVANGGFQIVPHVVQGRGQPRRPLELDPEALDRVRSALWAVVNEEGGSGVPARLPGLDVAGKTGTAQVVEQKTWTRSEELPEDQRDHSWFASFAPFEEPEIVIVVFVENGGLGSRVAAPIARQLYENYFRLRRARA